MKKTSPHPLDLQALLRQRADTASLVLVWERLAESAASQKQKTANATRGARTASQLAARRELVSDVQVKPGHLPHDEAARLQVTHEICRPFAPCRNWTFTRSGSRRRAPVAVPWTEPGGRRPTAHSRPFTLGRRPIPPILANGFIYTGNESDTFAVLHTGDTLDAMAVIKLGEGVRVPPAIARDARYARSTGQLWAFGTKRLS